MTSERWLVQRYSLTNRTYIVQTYNHAFNKWTHIPDSYGNKSYTCGWYDALIEMAPEHRYRIIQVGETLNTPDKVSEEYTPKQ